MPYINIIFTNLKFYQYNTVLQNYDTVIMHSKYWDPKEF